MKIGDGPKLPLLPKTDGSATKAAGAFPDVCKTPSPGGPVPIPYPNVGGDSFERVRKSPLGGLLGVDPTAKQPPAPAALAREVGGLLAAGEGVGALRSWLGGVAASGGGNVMEMLLLVMKESIAESNEDKKHYLGKLQGANETSQAMSRHMEDLAAASTALAGGEKGAAGAGAGVDPETLVQHVLRESYLESTEDLKDFAEKVKHFNEAKNSYREALADLREGGGQEDVIEWLEEKLSSLGDDAQLANVDLQNVLQKQQQTMQMMSNISKTLYDTAQAVIRKIGG
jgi:hypothetical protein